MVLTRTKTLLLLSSIALLTTPAHARTNQALQISSDRIEFTDASVKRRHHAKPRHVKPRYAKARTAKARTVKKVRAAKARTAKRYQIKRDAIHQPRRPQVVRQQAGYDAFASLPDQHAVVPGYYAPMHHTPMQFASTHHVPPPVRSTPRSQRVARTYHTDSVPVGGSDLVARARQYMGTNPTGWARVWCGRFMAMIAPDAAARIGNPNLARNWARLPRTGLQIGAIAVLSRNGGGHVGVVSGIDANGNPIIISGNHNRRVAEAVYPRGRVFAYVMP